MNKISKIKYNFSISPLGVKTLFYLYRLKVILFKIVNFGNSKVIPIRSKDQTNIPIIFFIVGSGRSGNTLLRAILNSNNNIVIPPELYSFRQIIVTTLKNRHLSWEQLCMLVVDLFFSTPDIDVWKINKSELLQDLHLYDKDSQTASNLILAFHEYYVKKHANNNNIIIGDKTPLNAYSVWWITELFPQAKFIHMHRDGRDVALSYVKSGLYNSYVKAAYRWNRSVSHVLKFERKLGSTSKIVKCSYENLVLQPKLMVQKLCVFLQVEFSEEMLTSHQKQYASMGDTTKFSHHDNVQKSVFTSSIGKWNKMEEDDIKLITPILNENLKALKYINY
ncbi:sulfotransferase family protein [Winogradskyella vidalii]|uniref:sulfotransferase family protein n=1 Tax=Winogradskyella vidalii TaxID=2615024 RepID=UPI0015CB1219|nr:sulfotransferase [Winogradskyella vidalii]